MEVFQLLKWKAKFIFVIYQHYSMYNNQAQAVSIKNVLDRMNVMPLLQKNKLGSHKK